MSISENMLILPALYIIKRDGYAKTEDLIRELTVVFNPQGEDAKILDGRNDTKFSQKVRNLVSHRLSNHMDEYTTFEDGIYAITPKGEDFLNTKLQELDYLFSQKFTYQDTIKFAQNLTPEGAKFLIFDEIAPVEEGKLEAKMSSSRKRSKKLRDAAIEYYSSKGTLKCVACGFSFEEKYGELGKNFIEIHHEKPICQYDSDGEEKSIKDALPFVKPLCSNCHRMIHRNPKKPLSIDELIKIITPSS